MKKSGTFWESTINKLRGDGCTKSSNGEDNVQNPFNDGATLPWVSQSHDAATTKLLVLVACLLFQTRRPRLLSIYISHEDCPSASSPLLIIRNVTVAFRITERKLANVDMAVNVDKTKSAYNSYTIDIINEFLDVK